MDKIRAGSSPVFGTIKNKGLADSSVNPFPLLEALSHRSGQHFL